MDLVRFGIDTVRVAHELVEPLPLGDEGYRRELAASGWQVKQLLQQDSTLGLYDSRTAFLQDEKNSTLRTFIQNAGRTVVQEFSAPRIISDSVLNLELATYEQVLDVTQQVLQQVRESTPAFGDTDSLRWRRVDTAADIAAGDAKPGLIAAAGQFVIPGARKVTRQLFPNETGRVTTSQMTFRGYDKGRELENKTARVLRELDQTKRQEMQAILKAHQAAGTVRLELENTPKKHRLTGEDVQNSNIKWSDVVEAGFSGGKITIGGLDYIRREVDGRADLSPQTRNALIAFAVRYAELGEAGMLAVMKRATFYRHKARFLDAGLNLDDVCTYSGEIDLRPIIREVRGA